MKQFKVGDDKFVVLVQRGFGVDGANTGAVRYLIERPDGTFDGYTHVFNDINDALAEFNSVDDKRLLDVADLVRDPDAVSRAIKQAAFVKAVTGVDLKLDDAN